MQDGRNGEEVYPPASNTHHPGARTRHHLERDMSIIYPRVTTHDIRTGDLISCAAGIFRVSNRRISTSHRTPAVGHLLTREELDAAENDTDCIVFDGVAEDPTQGIQKWTIQGNPLATFGLVEGAMTTFESVVSELVARGLPGDMAWNQSQYLSVADLKSTNGDAGLAADMAQEIHSDALCAIDDQDIY